MKQLYRPFLVLLIGLAGGYSIAILTPWTDGTQSVGTDERILYWVAPMDPNYRRDAPGKSPMGMDLVPVYGGDERSQAIAESSITIDPSVINNIGVRTAKVELASLRPSLQTVGRIMFDEERVANLHLRASGWIERLAIRSEGEAVKEGDLLFEVYSPDLVNAQAEFLQALRIGRTELIDASRERLRALDIAEVQIAEIEEAGKPQQYIKVYAPISGVVTTLNAADGQYVKPETEIIALADLSVVWLMSDVFEASAAQVRTGLTIKAQSKFEPGGVITGVVDYIYPDLNPVTRTIPVRTVLQNLDERLKPGMFMTVEIEGPARPETTVIPREALIRTGREERVILALGDGKFQPAAVVSGMEADNKIEILSGLSAGEAVVASGQFLIDSESSFAGAGLRLQAPEMSTADAEAEGVGTFNSISEDRRSINTNHGPIDALGWPAMTMDIALAPGVTVGEIEIGTDIRFTLGRDEDGMFVITSISPAGEQRDHADQHDMEPVQ